MTTWQHDNITISHRISSLSLQLWMFWANCFLFVILFTDSFYIFRDLCWCQYEDCITYNDTIKVIRSHQSLNFITCPVYIIYQVHNWKLQYYIIQKISMKGICPFQRPESVLIYSCCMRELGEGVHWFNISQNGYTGHFCTEGSI